VAPSFLEELSLSGTAFGLLQISVGKKHEKTRNRGKKLLLRRRRGVLQSKGGDGRASAAVAHALQGHEGEEEEDFDAAAALPGAVAPGERQACIRAAAPRRGRDATATRLRVAVPRRGKDATATRLPRFRAR